MVLVGYSDSEDSDNEEASKPTPAPKPAQNAKPSTSNFTIDRANPTKIRVNLSSTLPEPSDNHEDGEPAAKRPRIGGAGAGAFSGFNAMLPAPKRDNVKPGSAGTNANKAPARKVFSLKTGAEPAFSRESDAELKELFSEQDQTQDSRMENNDGTSTIPNNIPRPQFLTESESTSTSSKPFLFKPLSVTRGPKKKKTVSQITNASVPPIDQSTKAASRIDTTESTNGNQITDAPNTSKPKPKISLFSSGPVDLPPDPEQEPDHYPDDEDDEIIEVLDDPQSFTATPSQQSESLTSIAASLNLTPAERRQLLGRKHNATSNNIITFNTDTEYATNQALNANAEAVQHNPVRAIGGGKHSLKSLVANAQGQKDALEESFATGRKNKREAGSKYGW